MMKPMASEPNSMAPSDTPPALPCPAETVGRSSPTRLLAGAARLAAISMGECPINRAQSLL